ncbi:MAG: peptide deformylase [Bacteroidales bacterium]
MTKRILAFLLPAFLLFSAGFQCKKDQLISPPQSPDTLSLTQFEKDSILKGDTNDVMRILTIFNYNDSIKLRASSHEVRPDPNDTVLYRLARRMYYTLKAANGVGIAGPQVGINRDIIWVERLDKTGKPFECYLNPKITLYSNKPIIFIGDGCLSIPGQYGNSHRFSAVVINYDKLDGTHHSELVEGYSGSNFTAVIFQHEIDHLFGILFIDRLNGKATPVEN